VERRNQRPEEGVGLARIHGICLVKNEDDIIAQSLTFAAPFCERIYVIDNGSTDDTWTIVNDLAREHGRIVPFEQTREPYGDWLRARVFNEMHRKLSEEDWWLILDADEFFVEDPRTAVEVALRQRADVVAAWQIQFYFTEKDLEAWTRGEDIRETPIFSRRRYYQINWQEPRLFRNRRLRPWDISASIKLPDGPHQMSAYRPFNRHYQFRDPAQMEKRLALRYGHALFPHVHSPEWRDQIRDARTLNYHRDEDTWHFSPAGLLYFYRRCAYYRITSAWRGSPLTHARKILAAARSSR
jgi:glycosyltransferase involved in cell wall biosynthesis